MRIQLEAIYEKGVFHPSQPVPLAEHQRVTVAIEPAMAAPPRPMTLEEWRNYVLSTAGSITDPTFLRHDLGAYEQREQLP